MTKYPEQGVHPSAPEGFELPKPVRIPTPTPIRLQIKLAKDPILAAIYDFGVKCFIEASKHFPTESHFQEITGCMGCDWKPDDRDEILHIDQFARHIIALKDKFAGNP
jgi:hypothetical protein